jgi:hypothetical protein
MSCNVAFNATLDLSSLGGSASVVVGNTDAAASWTELINNNLVWVSPLGVGSKPETEKQRLKLTSCTPESIVGNTHTINFRSYAMDQTSFSEADWWNAVLEKPTAFTFGYVGCDDLLYLDYDAYTAGASTASTPAEINPGFEFSVQTLDYIKEEDSTQPDRYETAFSFEYNKIVRPVSNAAVLAAMGL